MCLFCIEGKMKFYLYSVLNSICYFYQSTSTKIKLELKEKFLNCGYGINYKYEGILVHSFDRFYIVTKFILPSIGDVNFSKLNYDNTCTYQDNKNTHSTKTKKHVRSYDILQNDRIICGLLQKIDKIIQHGA